MLELFILLVCLLCAGLLWVFFRPNRAKDTPTASRTVYAPHTQRRPISATSHLTGEAYGKLLRAAQGDRQQVELWIVEAQCNLPGHTRSEVIELLAKER